MSMPTPIRESQKEGVSLYMVAELVVLFDNYVG